MAALSQSQTEIRRRNVTSHLQRAARSGRSRRRIRRRYCGRRTRRSRSRPRRRACRGQRLGSLARRALEQRLLRSSVPGPQVIEGERLSSRSSFRSRKNAGQLHRLRRGQPGQTQNRLCRCGHAPAHRNRNVQGDGGCRYDPGPVPRPRLNPCACPPPCRKNRRHVRSDAVVHRAYQG